MTVAGGAELRLDRRRALGGQELLPEFKERDFLMHWLGKPGMSRPEMYRITVQASKELRAIPGVAALFTATEKRAGFQAHQQTIVKLGLRLRARINAVYPNASPR